MQVNVGMYTYAYVWACPHVCARVCVCVPLAFVVGVLALLEQGLLTLGGHDQGCYDRRPIGRHVPGNEGEARDLPVCVRVRVWL